MYVIYILDTRCILYIYIYNIHLVSRIYITYIYIYIYMVSSAEVGHAYMAIYNIWSCKNTMSSVLVFALKPLEEITLLQVGDQAA